MVEPHIPPLAAETLFQIGPVPITNAIINTWIAIVLLAIFGLILKRKLSLYPGKLQNITESFLESLLGYFDQVTGDRKKTLKFLPLVGSIFFFVLLSNWLGLLPGTGTITLGHYPLLRPAATDLNLTVAMALVTVVSSHIIGIFTIGLFTHVGKYIQIGGLFRSFRKGPIAVFTAIIELGVGLLEIISEVAKVLSLSLRLFGNIFAGEILLVVMASIFSVILPTPFMMLELLVGLVQAGVFSILTLVYITMATTAPHSNEAH
jgi:F-type H+-transporting ATPase subunit a